MESYVKNLFVWAVLLSPTWLAAQVGDRFDFNDQPRTIEVNRWVSPVVGDFVTIIGSHAKDAQLESWGYKGKIFQYIAPIDKPNYDNTVAIYRWTMPNCKEFIVLGEHEHTDAELENWGYRDKKFLFYASKTRVNRSFVAVNRWVNALPQGNSCRDYTLSVLETEFTDEQLTSWGYSGKKLQFYVVKP